MKMFAIAFTLTAALTFSASAQQAAGWDDNCETTDGWHGNKGDPGMHADVEQAETGVIRIVQKGDDTWGKAAFVVENIDLSKTPILELKVNKVDKDAGFKIAVAPRDWSELVTVIDRTSADGLHKGNIQKAINKQSQKPEAYGNSFNIVVIIEGKDKGVWIDDVKIHAE